MNKSYFTTMKLNIADIVSLDVMMRGVDFLNDLHFKINIFTKYRKVIINGILNHLIKPITTTTWQY